MIIWLSTKTIISRPTYFVSRGALPRTLSSLIPTLRPDKMSTVLLISLEAPPWPIDLYDEQFAALRTKANVVEPTSSQEALDHLSSSNSHIAAVLVTEPSIMKRKNQAISTKLVEYTLAGGTVILGCLCASNSKPSDTNRFFQDVWGLPWKVGAYYRTTSKLNQMANPRFHQDRYASLPNSYSMKAVHLKGVPSEARVYVPSDESVIESAVFAPEPVPTPWQTPMVFAPFGQGYLGWVGDVNAEEGSGRVVFAMLNL